MPPLEHLQVAQQDDVLVVRFLHAHIIDGLVIEVANELFSVADRQDCTKLLLNFSGVERLSTEMFARVIVLNRKMYQKGGRLKLCDICPYLREIFTQTNLDQLFEIGETEAMALKAFA